MSLGDIYTTSTPDSAAKKNLFGIPSGTGAYLASLDKTKITAVFCTATGSGLTADHFYVVSADNTSFIDVSVQAPHVHDSSSTGGTYMDILIANPKIVDLNLITIADILVANWRQTLSGTASLADDLDGTTGEQASKLLTGATSGSGATIRARCPAELSFAYRSIFQFKCRLSDTTSLAMHNGVQADVVTDADGALQKYNAEVCTATNTNWWLRSANGTTSSTSDSGTAFTTNRVAIRIVHYPDLGTPRLDMYIDAGSVFQKTTHIPTSTNTNNNNIIVHSLKNSAAADRNAFIYGSRLRFTASDEWI